MTISLSTNVARQSYAVAQGATQSAFTVSFAFFDDDDLNVFVDGTLKTLTTHYTVSGGDGSAGSVTMTSGNEVTGVSGGSTVVITRDIDLDRTTDFPASGPFAVATLNTELDKITAQFADRKDVIDRSIRLQDQDEAQSMELPLKAARLGKVLGFNATTGAVEAGPTIADTQSLAAVTADIAALADIEDGTTATDAISGLAAIKANVTTVAGISANVTTVAGNTSNINAVAGDATDIGTVAGISSNVTTVAGISSSVTTVAGKATEVGRLGTADAVSDMNTLGTSSNVTNMNTLAGIASDITTTAGVASSIAASGTNASNAASSATAAASSATAAASSATAAAASQTAAAASAASAASAFDNFDDTYLGSKTSNPTVDNDGDALTSGDLYFNSTANEMRVYDGANWIAATSAGNVSLVLYEYTATAGQTTFSGSDDNSATLSYTVDNLQVVMNGIVLDPSDFTATNGTSVVLASGAALNDLVNIYAFKSFTTADMVSKTNGGTFSGNVTFSGNLTADGGTIKLDGNYPTGTNNVALGDGALSGGSLSGGSNVAIGTSALDANTSGTTNIAIGVNALGANTTASDSVAVGHSALKLNTTGAKNVAVGYEALDANSSASNNTAVGYGTLTANTTGTPHVAIGTNALAANTTGNGSVAVGFNALDAATTADNNTAVGNYALTSLTTAGGITAVGYNAGNNLTTAPSVVAVGAYAGDAITTGGYHTCVGAGALGAATTGTGNTALGFEALKVQTTAQDNVGIGYRAGVATTTGSYNCYIGFGSGQSGTTAFGNSFMGTNYSGGAGSAVTTGDRLTIVGGFSGNSDGVDLRTQSRNIALSDGHGLATYVSDTSRIRLGNSGNGVPHDSVWNGQATNSGAVFFTSGSNNDNYYLAIQSKSNTNVYLSKKSGYTDSGYITFWVNGSGVGNITTNGSSVSYNTSSDHRLKDNVADLTGATTRLKQLNPVRFNFIADADTTVDGFLAHEVQTVVPEAVTGSHNEVDDDGNPKYQGIDQSKLVPLLVATIQELEARITALEAGS